MIVKPIEHDTYKKEIVVKKSNAFDMKITVYGESRASTTANADRIIKAADCHIDLLEACKMALGAFEHNNAINWDDLRRAIEKAEGR